MVNVRCEGMKEKLPDVISLLLLKTTKGYAMFKPPFDGLIAINSTYAFPINALRDDLRFNLSIF